MSEKVYVEISEFFVEVEPVAADGTGGAGLAPTVDAVAVVAVSRVLLSWSEQISDSRT